LTLTPVFHQVGVITQNIVDTVEDVRAAESEKVAPESLSFVKPSDDDPIRSLVLTVEDVSSLTPANWNIIVRKYTEIVFAHTTSDQKM